MHTPQSTYRGREEIRECIFPLSWSKRHNFVRGGSYSERGWVSIVHLPPSPHHHGLIFPSWWIVGQKMAVATLFTLLYTLINIHQCTLYSAHIRNKLVSDIHPHQHPPLPPRACFRQLTQTHTESYSDNWRGLGVRRFSNSRWGGGGDTLCLSLIRREQ